MRRVSAYRCQGTAATQQRGQRNGATWWLPILPALIILAGLSGCGAAGAPAATPPGGTLVVSPTPTLPAAQPLIWSAARSPVGPLSPLPNGYTRDGTIAVPAPSDRDVAYACAPAPDPKASDVLAWVTRDRGVHWDTTAGITVSAAHAVEVNSCGIVVDATAAATAMAQIGYMPSGQSGGCLAGSCISYALFVTTDMGQQWLPLTPPRGPSSPDGQPLLDTIYDLATYQQTTYGLFEPTPEDLSELTGGVFMSRDHLRTWTLVPGLPYRIGQDATAYQVAQFWLNPVTGAMLAIAANNMAGSKETFLSSKDPGSSWTTLTVPPLVSTGYDFTVQQPFADQPWRICAGTASYPGTAINGETSTGDILVCTVDGGAHWKTTQMDQSNNPGTELSYTLVGIADDGAVLLMTTVGLKRVVPGVNGMQSLGPAPMAPNLGAMTYVDGGGSGALWSIWSPPGGDTSSVPPSPIYTARYV
jgi:hypothetical protein